jgi:hypothetical protein
VPGVFVFPAGIAQAGDEADGAQKRNAE